jgi:hypothetical protein
MPQIQEKDEQMKGREGERPASAPRLDPLSKTSMKDNPAQPSECGRPVTLYHQMLLLGARSTMSDDAKPFA